MQGKCPAAVPSLTASEAFIFIYIFTSIDIYILRKICFMLRLVFLFIFGPHSVVLIPDSAKKNTPGSFRATYEMLGTEPSSVQVGYLQDKLPDTVVSIHAHP